MLVLLGCEFEFLLVLEQVLLVAERFLLLVLELVVRVVVAVIVDELQVGVRNVSDIVCKAKQERKGDRPQRQERKTSRTLCSRLVMVFRIFFNNSWYSLSGAVTLASTSSISGSIASRSSTMNSWYWSMLRRVVSAYGWVAVREVSPWSGEKRVVKAVAKPVCEVSMAARRIGIGASVSGFTR